MSRKQLHQFQANEAEQAITAPVPLGHPAGQHNAALARGSDGPTRADMENNGKYSK